MDHSTELGWLTKRIAELEKRVADLESKQHFHAPTPPYWNPIWQPPYVVTCRV